MSEKQDWSKCAWCDAKPFPDGEWDAPICPDCEAVDAYENGYFGGSDVE
jgi:hypothetical protein